MTRFDELSEQLITVADARVRLVPAGRSSSVALDETSQPIELLLSVRRDGGRTLGSQIEDAQRRNFTEMAELLRAADAEP